jgi:hypothetical protein
MARMPGASWLGEHSPGTAMSRYDIVCVHTIVGYAPAHAAHFSTHHDGRIQQSRDTRYRSAANLDGNHRVIAIENEDHGGPFPDWNVNDGHAVPDFTAAQVEANARIFAWAHETHGIPLQLAPNSKPGSQGLAYHRQGIDGNWSDYKYPGRVSGGEVWTSSRGKVCPGDRRIARLPEILARAKQLVNGDDDMPLNDADKQFIINTVADGINAAFNKQLKTVNKDGETIHRSIRALAAYDHAIDVDLHNAEYKPVRNLTRRNEDGSYKTFSRRSRDEWDHLHSKEGNLKADQILDEVDDDPIVPLAGDEIPEE